MRSRELLLLLCILSRLSSLSVVGSGAVLLGRLLLRRAVGSGCVALRILLLLLLLGCWLWLGLLWLCLEKLGTGVSVGEQM